MNHRWWWLVVRNLCNDGLIGTGHFRGYTGLMETIDEQSGIPTRHFKDVGLLVLQRRLTSADLDFGLCQTGTVLKRGWLCDPLIRSFKRGSPNPSL